jgi:hypothetical protein
MKPMMSMMTPMALQRCNNDYHDADEDADNRFLTRRLSSLRCNMLQPSLQHVMLQLRTDVHVAGTPHVFSAIQNKVGAWKVRAQPSPDADVAGVSPSPGADVAGVIAVVAGASATTVQMATFSTS